jgi:hypothetical protein
MSSIPNIPDTIAREIYAELCRSLPPPPDETPERRAIREQHAMISVAHLLPANAAEADIAAQIVAAQFHARDALQAASRHIPGPDPGARIDPDELRRCRAQAASMMRQADSGIRTLLRMQAAREKAEDAARPAAMERAGYWFRSVTAPEPDQRASPGSIGGPAEPTPEPAAGSPNLTHEPSAANPPKPEYGAMTPAERYVTLYPDRAAAVLGAGGLPASVTFPPPQAAVIAELLTSTSPIVHAFRQANQPVAA